MTITKSDNHKIYMHYAKHCLEMALKAPDLESRIIEREMVAEWLRLADIVHHQPATA